MSEHSPTPWLVELTSGIGGPVTILRTVDGREVLAMYGAPRDVEHTIDAANTIDKITAERDGLRKALEEAKERFANLASGRCPAPPGTANDPVAFRDWAEGYALIGFNSVSIALATPRDTDAEQGGGT